MIFAQTMAVGSPSKLRSEDDEQPMCAIYMQPASDRMLEAALRLGQLFARPKDAAVLVLAPLAIRELLFHLLSDP